MPWNRCSSVCIVTDHTPFQSENNTRVIISIVMKTVISGSVCVCVQRGRLNVLLPSSRGRLILRKFGNHINGIHGITFNNNYCSFLSLGPNYTFLSLQIMHCQNTGWVMTDGQERVWRTDGDGILSYCARNWNSPRPFPCVSHFPSRSYSALICLWLWYDFHFVPEVKENA